MGRKYAIRNQGEFHFVTFTVFGWVDVFVRKEYIFIFLDSVRFCQKEKGLEVGAWCIMSSHIHMILRSKGQQNLESIIRDLKSFTSRHIRMFMESSPYESRKDWILDVFINAGKKKSNTKDFQFWQHHNHPIELSTIEIANQRLKYVHENPVVAGYVDQARDWVYSSARDYEDEKGLIEIEFLY